MLLGADSSGANLTDPLDLQSPCEVIDTAQHLLRAPHHDPDWCIRAAATVLLLQRLIRHERHWLTQLDEPPAKRNLNVLINDTMTCLLGLEFALASGTTYGEAA